MESHNKFPTSALRVDRDQCRKIAERIRSLHSRADYFIPLPELSVSADLEANFWMIVTGICQQTRTLEGEIGGKWIRGSDFLIRAAAQTLVRDPEFFSAARLLDLTADALRALVSSDGVAEHSQLDRVAERLDLVHGIARLLAEKYDGSAMQIFRAARARVAGPGGLLARLAECEAYSDPVEKKSFLLIMFLDKRGLWPIEDPESLEIPVDYHVMRVVLRSGMVIVENSELHRMLSDKKPVGPDVDETVRRAVREACKQVLLAGVELFTLDNLFWMIGRNCCFYEHEPICGPNVPCTLQDRCSLIKSFDYACPGHCPLDGACRGSREAPFRNLWETNYQTHYY